jgi:hypothetical protein
MSDEKRYAYIRVELVKVHLNRCWIKLTDRRVIRHPSNEIIPAPWIDEEVRRKKYRYHSGHCHGYRYLLSNCYVNPCNCDKCVKIRGKIL